MRVSKNFLLQEFIPGDIYLKFGEKSIWFIDPRIIKIAQFFRDRYSVAITINDWYKGGNRSLSGFRPPLCKIGAKLSQHRWGRAVDLKWEGLDPEKVRKDIKDNQQDFLAAGVTAVEDGTDTWLHIDCRATGLKEILFIPFYKK